MTDNSMNLSAFSNGIPNGFYSSGENNVYNEPIFDNHASYRRPFLSNENNRSFQSMAGYDTRIHQSMRYPSPSMTGNEIPWQEPSRFNSSRYISPLPRSVSAYENSQCQIHSAGTVYGQSNYHSQNPQHPHYLPHSVSLDTWEREHIYLQHKKLANLYSKVDSARNELVDTEHYTLAKEQEFETLQKVAKDPTEEDITILNSELLGLQRQLQSAYDECEKLNIDLPGESPSSPTPYQRQQSWRQSRQDPITSPTTMLLLNPYDDSLSSPMWR